MPECHSQSELDCPSIDLEPDFRPRMPENSARPKELLIIRNELQVIACSYNQCCIFYGKMLSRLRRSNDLQLKAVICSRERAILDEKDACKRLTLFCYYEKKIAAMKSAYDLKAKGILTLLQKRKDAFEGDWLLYAQREMELLVTAMLDDDNVSIPTEIEQSW
jgi:hypothetical protein